MSESQQPISPQDAGDGSGEEAQLDALPVLAGTARLLGAQPPPYALPAARPAGVVLPAVQAAAMAAGGFVAGAAVVGLVHRRQRRSSALGKGRRAPRALSRSRTAGAGGAARAAELVQIVGSRSLLVDVHLLGGAGDR